MKKAVFLLVLFISSIAALAQVPEAFNYQAVVRNSSGEIVANKAVSFKISILVGSQNGSSVYSETHSVTTNDFGLANMKIGWGSNQTGSFNPGGWGGQNHFIKIELDLNGGSSYSHMGTTQLLSVPYAFHAQTVAEDEVEDADADPENEIQELQLSGRLLSISKVEGSVTLPTSGDGGDNWGTDVVESNATLEGEGTTANPLKIAQQGASEGHVLKWTGTEWIPTEEDNPDSDPTNEIQELTLSGTDLSLSKEGGTVDLSSLGGSGGDNWGSDVVVSNASLEGEGTTANPLKIAQQGASEGHVLKWTGTEWVPTEEDNPDDDPANEIQELSLSGTDLTLSKEGGSVDLSSLGGGSSLWTESGSNIYFDTGNVGIGTSSPTEKLEVDGDIAFSTGVDRFLCLPDGTKSLFLGGKKGVTAAYSVHLVTNGGSGGEPRLSVKSDMVGINTVSPTTDLDVNGQIKVRGGSPGAGKVLTSDATGLATWETLSGGGGLNLPYHEQYNGDASVIKITHNGSGIGIYVDNISTTGNSSSIYGRNNSSSGTCLFGLASSATGATYGVVGHTISPSGTGVKGHSFATSGINYGVWGRTESSSGYSGYFDGGKFYVGGNTGIGTENPTTKLEVAGQVKITGGSPGAGKVLTSDASGLATWENPSGGGLTLPYFAQEASNSPLIQITNVGGGIGIMGSASVTSGPVVGVWGSGRSPSGVGVIGQGEASSGIPIGVKGIVNYSGGYSGYFQGGKFYVEGNTGIGTDSPTTKLDVEGQIKIRGGSPGAGKILTSDASGLATWETPSGGSSLWSESGSNIYFNTGNVGIGTSSPTDKLEVQGDITLSSGTNRYISLPDGSNSLFIGGKVGATAPYAVQIVTNSGSGGAERMTLKSGMVGIETTSPTQTLDVNGNVRIRSIASGAYAGVVNRTSDGTLTTSTSDARLKENIETIEGGLGKVMQLRGVNFTWIDNPDYGNRIGFLAQELEQVIPELVFTNPTDGYKGVNYAEMSAVLVEAVKELKAENDDLKKRLDKLEKMVLDN